MKQFWLSLAKPLAVIAIGLMSTAGVAQAATQLIPSTPINLSNQADLDGGNAFKTKLIRFGDGTLMSVFGDAVGSNLVYDVKGDKERVARDIFATRCNPATAPGACKLDTDWGTPVNISNTALLTSMSADWTGTTDASTALLPYYGDSDKPNIFNSGAMAVVTWVDKYCDSGSQRAVQYIQRDFRVIPFSCTYESHSLNKGASWSAPVRLSSGERDAKQDANKGAFSSTSGIAKWSITWQEDPLGLQLGSADGPGDGASGATVSHGTDVWYATTDNLASNPWSVVRLTNNTDGFGVTGSVNPVRDGTGAEVDPNTIDKGQVGASRANLAIVTGKALVAYEETKASVEIEEGKYVRYHVFPQSTPPTGASGCILSTPTKNARRVRFVTQGVPGSAGMKMGIFWKEGDATQGGPSDILTRVGFSDFTPANMVPPVDVANCELDDFFDVIANLNNPMAYNISAETPTANPANLTDDTELNFIEGALAHRGLIRGDDLYVGYSYTSDLAQLLYTNTENYNFWIRHYNAASGTWDNPVKVSDISDTLVNGREPRLVGTPGNGANCPGGVPVDPNNPAHLEQCQDRNTFIVAWGTQSNVSAWDPAGPEELTIFMTRTTDKGATYEPIIQVPTVATGAFESQLRPTPDGNKVFFAWNEVGTTAEAMFNVITAEPVPGISVVPTTGLVTTEAGGTASFDVVLESQPSAWVFIKLGRSDFTEADISTFQLTFTPHNWDIPQTVTVTGKADDLVDGDVEHTIILKPATSNDLDYDGLDPDDVGVTNQDIGISVMPTSGLITTEDGGTAAFDVVLQSKPSAWVFITINRSDHTEGKPSSFKLAFTPLNWDVPQTVTVTGLDDALVDGDVMYSVILNPATSNDPAYNGIDPDDVSLTNIDNDD